MADEEKKDQPKDDAKDKGKGKEKKEGGSKKFAIIMWGVIGLAGLFSAAGGFALAQLLAGSVAEPAVQQEEPQKKIDDVITEQNEQAQAWLYEMEPVIANLDEPGVTRYVRATVILEITPDLEQAKGETFLESKKLILRDWLAVFMSGLSLEETRGAENRTRIKKQIRDQFNDILSPNSEAVVERVLFKEFVVD